jgi:hypothetical protein
MKPGNIFQLEMRVAFARKRSFIIKLGFTFLLGFPFVLLAIPIKVQVAGLVMLVLFTSFFGAAVSLVRRRADGFIRRLRILPIRGWVILGDFLIAGVVIDLMQMGILLAIFTLVHGSGVTPGAVILTGGVFFLAVLFLNIAGMLLGFAMKSNSEVHLVGALAIGILAFISDIIPVPGRLIQIIETTGRWSPVAAFARSLERLALGTGTVGSMEVLASGIFICVMFAIFIFRISPWELIFPRKSDT